MPFSLIFTVCISPFSFAAIDETFSFD
jgi:hypothetical protein